MLEEERFAMELNNPDTPEDGFSVVDRYNHNKMVICVTVNDACSEVEAMKLAEWIAERLSEADQERRCPI